jgi:hypothetical protein
MNDAKSLAADVRLGEKPLPPGYLDWAEWFARSRPEFAKMPRAEVERLARELFADLVATGYIGWKPTPQP